MGSSWGWSARWWSGQQKRVLSGIDGLLLLVVIGDGRLVVPVDFAIRRPDPVGPGAPCRDKLTWARLMLDERLAAFRRRGVALPPPMVVADSWFSDSKLMQHVHDAHQGTLLVEGKQSYIFTLADGRQVKGRDLIQGEAWRWRQHPWEPRVRYVRLRATSPTYGQVTVVIVDEPGQDRFYLLCLETDAECTAVDPAVAAAHLDRVCLSDPEASVGDRGVSGAQRRRLLWAPGVASDGEFHLVLHRACHLQRASDDGRDHL